MIKVLVLGDSHSNIFSRRIAFLFKKLFLNKFEFLVCSVPGATISGIENPNSKTNTAVIFQKALNKNTQCEYCILYIGEVDTGFLLWYKFEQEGLDLEDLFNLTIDKYTGLVQKVFELGYKPIVISTPLPTIKDGTDYGPIASARKLIKATQIERTKLTLRFNSRMKDICLKKKYGFVDLDNISIAPSGVVRTFLLNLNRKDHHYNPITHSLILFYALKNFFK